MKKTFISILIISTVFFIGTIIFTVKYFPTWAIRGQFGDMFNVANTVFAFLSFIGVIYALLQTSEQLKIMRDDIKLQDKASSDETNHRTIILKIEALNILIKQYSTELNELKKLDHRDVMSEAEIKNKLINLKNQLEYTLNNLIN